MLIVRAGSSVVLDRTVRLSRLVVAEGGVLAAAPGRVLTLTVDGVETGTALTAVGGQSAAIAAGDYRGAVVVTVSRRNSVPFQGLAFQFRQALYVAPGGPDASRSVTAAWLGGRVGSAGAEGLTLVSRGEVFNGVYVDQGRYILNRPRIAFIGNGRCDFVGYGAALMATGPEARLVVDGAQVETRGAVRTAVVADGGATVVVRNSRMHTADGVLPKGYVPTVDIRTMQAAPWMLGIDGDVRTTLVTGEGSTAAYIDSWLSSEGWGVLSADYGTGCRIAAINSRVATGASGYGSYSMRETDGRFLGCDFDVADYASVIRGGSVYYGDSGRAAVGELNRGWRLGLTEQELSAIVPRACTVRSRRFGLMWHGEGSARIDGGTVLRTGGTTFLVKGQTARISVDGSAGARLLPGNGILLQVIDDDDPGMLPSANMSATDEDVYRQPTAAPARITGFDTTTVHPADVAAEFSDMELAGDFFNGTGGGTSLLPGLNLGLTLTRCRLVGRVSASVARHRDAVIGHARYRELGVVTDSVAPVVDNGVVLTLGPGSAWTPTGTCHLSALHLDPTASLTAPDGRGLTMTVDGHAVRPAAGGGWSGAIEIRVR